MIMLECDSAIQNARIATVIRVTRLQLLDKILAVEGFYIIFEEYIKIVWIILLYLYYHIPRASVM